MMSNDQFLRSYLAPAVITRLRLRLRVHVLEPELAAGEAPVVTEGSRANNQLSTPL